MTPNEPLQHYQPRSTFSTWVGVVLVFAFFGLLAFVAVKASPRGNSYEKNRAKVRAEKLEAAQKENLAALTTYSWVDKTKGIARIPINDAMKLTVAQLADKKPTTAGPIVVASPSAAPQTSPGASPAASPATSASASPAANTNAAASPSTTPKPTSVTGPHSEAHNQPAAAINPPPAPPNTQPGPNSSPAASPPSAATKAQASPASSASPSAAGSPLPVRGKTP